jgi:transposase-like protein
VYLYRAVDKEGNTVESYLSRTRDVTAAKAFFRKAFRRHGDPRVITLDGFEPTHAALRRMGMNNEFNYRWEGAGPPAHQGPGRSDARVQALLQRAASASWRGTRSKDYQRPVSSTRKVRYRSGRDMAQRTRGVKLVPICNRTRKSRQATMLLTKPVHDACRVEIVGGYLKFNEIARGKADEPLPHLSRDVGEYEMFISKRDPKHSSGQHGDNLSFGFNRTLH